MDTTINPSTSLNYQPKPILTPDDAPLELTTLNPQWFGFRLTPQVETPLLDDAGQMPGEGP